MLIVQEGRFEPGYVELSEGALDRLDAAAMHLDSPPYGKLSHFCESVLEVALGCGSLVIANTDADSAVGIRDQLLANMHPHVAFGFRMGYDDGMAKELIASNH